MEAARDTMDFIAGELMAGSPDYRPTPTTGPGKLRLTYIDGTRLHTASARYTALGSPFNHSQNNTDALQWSDYLKNCISSDLNVVGWEAFDYLGHLVDDATLPTPIAGTRGSVTGDIDSISYSLRISGHGILTTSDDLSGDTNTRIFPLHGWTCPRGQRYIPIQSDLDLYNYGGFLATHPRLWADKTGRKAGMRGEVATQFHAALQNRWGR